MLLYSYVIPLDPRTKKNHQSICGTGKRCPVCGKPARQYIRQSEASSKFAFDAAKFLQPKPTEPIDYQCHVAVKFYMATQRKVDETNLRQNIDDILVANGILADDNVKIIRCRDGSGVWFDKENPRAEIYIFDMEGVEEYGI